MDDYSRFVPAVKFELIPIKNLVSNQEYQRALSQKHINRAAFCQGNGRLLFAHSKSNR